MKKALLVTFAILGLSSQASAITCSQVDKLADADKAWFNPNQYEDDSGYPTQYDPYEAKVLGAKGFRAHFHTAPSSQCKIKNLFIIPNDKVTVNYTFDYENQEWLHVTYWNKKSEETSGWIKAKELSSPKRASQN